MNMSIIKVYLVLFLFALCFSSSFSKNLVVLPETNDEANYIDDARKALDQTDSSSSSALHASSMDVLSDFPQFPSIYPVTVPYNPTAAPTFSPDYTMTIKQV